MIKPLYKTDPIGLPRYTLPEVAHYLRISKYALRRWVSGKVSVASGPGFHRPLIQRPDPSDPRLSFSNLLEAYVIDALRRHCPRGSGLLSGNDRHLVLQHLEKLVDVRRGVQEELPEIFETYLQRIERDSNGRPFRIFPITRSNYQEAPKIIAIDPLVAFGRPVIERRSIKTSTIVERFGAGESASTIAEDYDLETFEIEEALRYEALTLAA